MAFLPGAFGASGLLLHHRGHETAHGLRRLILHLPCGVSVGTQGEACIIVAQYTGDCLDVRAVLECQSGEGVPEILGADVFQPSQGVLP